MFHWFFSTWSQNFIQSWFVVFDIGGGAIEMVHPVYIRCHGCKTKWVFSKHNNFFPCGNYQPLPLHQTCKTFHFVKHTLTIVHIGSFFLLAANMPFHKNVPVRSFYYVWAGPSHWKVQLCQNWYKTVTQDMSYTSLRLKPRLHIGLIWIWEWNQDFKWALYEFKTESKTQYMPYSSLRLRKRPISLGRHETERDTWLQGF